MAEFKDSVKDESPPSTQSSPVATPHRQASGPGRLKSSLSRAFLATGMPVTFRVSHLRHELLWEQRSGCEASGAVRRSVAGQQTR